MRIIFLMYLGVLCFFQHGPASLGAEFWGVFDCNPKHFVAGYDRGRENDVVLETVKASWRSS